MKGRPRGSRPEYGWSEAQEELEEGIHPEVVAARIGEPVAYILETADQQGWPISWQPRSMPSPDEMLTRFAALYGFDS